MADIKKRALTVAVDVYPGAEALDPGDAFLLNLARTSTGDAYAPYSGFRVAAALRLANGQTLTGTNQENAAYPAGLCAERVALSAASALYPGIPVRELAVSFFQDGGRNDRPVSPCGICRQTLMEYELRSGQPIRLILGGQTGEVIVVGRSADLLPLAFTAAEIA